MCTGSAVQVKECICRDCIPEATIYILVYKQMQNKARLNFQELPLARGVTFAYKNKEKGHYK